MNPLFIESIQAFPQVEDRSVKVKITLSNSSGIGGKKLQLSALLSILPKSIKPDLQNII